MINDHDKEYLIDALTEAFTTGELGDCIRVSLSLPNCGPWCGMNGREPVRTLFQLLLDYGDDGRKMWLGWQNSFHTPGPAVVARNLAPPSKESFIYFIRRGNCVKIGTSVDPRRRLHELQAGSPDKLQLWAVAPGDAETESILHSKFADFFLSGEWFQITKEIEDWIEEHCNA